MNRDEALFYEAMELVTPEAAGAFLDRACVGDDGLRQRVERLLAAHAESDSLLDGGPNVAAATCELPSSVFEKAGDRIGPYKLIQQLGEGGMGVVYMAQQTEPVKRLLALKIIKPGMDSRQVIARFEAERQALALMEHPNIARIFDAGMTGEIQNSERRMQNEGALTPALNSTGRPYFVMELVKGIPITEYCEEKRLTARERLELFLPVCLAVQHAHQKGIIHRDLKPSNVLVALYDGQPVPKVIDFGVAKATGGQLTEKTLVTNFGSLVGTLEYMSPEQAELNQLDVDTRSDIYSLGVLLYELLTGGTPVDRERLRTAAFGEKLRMIREEEAETVSARIARTRSAELGARSNTSPVPHSALRVPRFSELDWIVAKSLEKERSRRYESAAAFAADIQRYLHDEPVQACPPTAWYRFQKFARKHKPVLATAAAVALCLILGTTVSAWQAVRATAAEEQAAANEAVANANAEKADEKAKEATQERDEAQKQRDEVQALAEKLAAKEEELERTLYADHIYMAKEAWDGGNVDRTKGLLKRHLPQAGETDRRGFEWHYLNRLLRAGPLLSLKTAPAMRHLLTLSPDRMRLIGFKSRRPELREGKRVTTGPELVAWNLQTGQQELGAPLNSLPTTFKYGMVTFSPDGSRMAVSNSRFEFKTRSDVAGELKVWDTQTGREILSERGVVRSVIGKIISGQQDIFSPDSKLLLSVMENQSVKLWDMQTGQERVTLEGTIEPFHRAAFSHDGRQLAGSTVTRNKNTPASWEVRIWNVSTGRQVQKLKGERWIGELALSPDGQRLAMENTGEDERGKVKLWDVPTGKELIALSSDCDSFWELAFSADGTRLIGQGEKEVAGNSIESVTMWNAETGQQLVSLTADGFQFSPDGKCVAFSDSANSRTRVFDAQSGKIMLNVKSAGGEVAFSPDSKRLATDSGGVRIWDLKTGDELNHIKGFIGDFMLAFSVDGKRLIGGSDENVQVWDAEVEQHSAKKLLLPGVELNSGVPGGFSCPAVISSDFTRIAGISGKSVKLFDANTGQVLRTLSGYENTGHENNVLCVAISHDGKRVAASHGQGLSNSAGGTVKIWDAETGKEMSTIAGLARCTFLLKFSPDGQRLAGTPADLTITVWDAGSGRELYRLGTRPASYNNSTYSPFSIFAFSPDGKRLGWQGTIWDAETRARVVTPKDAKGPVRHGAITAFSQDGNRVLDKNGVWDAATGERLFTIDKMASPTFSPDGKRLADGRKIWDARTGMELLSLSQEEDIGQVAFSPDGHRLAVVNSWSNEITIYDATPVGEGR